MEQEALYRLSRSLQKWILEAAAYTRTQIKQPLTVSTKSGPNDLVTNVDCANQAFLAEKIKTAYPNAQLVGEEGAGEVPDDWQQGLTFFIDPIDGTMNFVKQRANFAIMIGVYEDGQPLFGIIYDVMADQLFWGGPQLGIFENEAALKNAVDEPLQEGLICVNTRMLVTNEAHLQEVLYQCSGVRIYGSAGITFAHLLKGQVQAYISKLAPWDIAAGRVLAEMLGFQVLQFDGQPISMMRKEGMIIAPKQAIQEIVTIMNGSND
ncbi:inositol monophosphatase family protein [Latilactobacillus curvatus]|uniref:inositol monophosphatase family protein n=1 Tax=Latilactobacillus curvatus TaxID=28038 RepID=UPI000975CAB6|nr:inositol monophosphatase family protein [Latilactobacillus curvatus]ASN61794.1 myo-inositol-1-monophosphatase [Latilactobacillus curvatus]MCT2879997.1 inositol monophosphatase family protein [Latilactobacillus curvatus]MCT3525431.1 inositol monophosphatase family protein [Latilactobacillus curvatus]UTB70318.1 myo-inositol-1-monophosphatase [Latilactobacillus curvatus]UTB74426.1 myo-inositol-1-monophosphatase [Latilactobacillus curvatus]